MLNSLFKQVTIIGLQKLVWLPAVRTRKNATEEGAARDRCRAKNGETGANERQKEAYCSRKHASPARSHSGLEKANGEIQYEKNVMMKPEYVGVKFERTVPV